MRAETINYRTGRSERNGLFDERIFGPEKNYECFCGKYKGTRYKGIICEKCGVEITQAVVRRTRMGHIELAVPVAHIWFMRAIPSKMSLLSDISLSDIQKVVYFSGYLVTSVYEDQRDKILKDITKEYKTKSKIIKDEKELEKLRSVFNDTKNEVNNIVKNKVLTERQYTKFSMKYGSLFDISIGAEALHELFQSIDLDKLFNELSEQLAKTRTVTVKKKIQKRLILVRSLLRSETKPEWMFVRALPVIPPALRPMVALEGGRWATSDLNDLYRRVINRNNRLKKLITIGAPEVIMRNEKRILQEAVDALIDNSMSRSGGSVAMSKTQTRALKSLSDSLKSKTGLFRSNLLGKRVDYSGRSHIVVGPTLKLDECGIPKKMVLELFKPFVIAKLLEREIAFNIRGASKMIEEPTSEIWAILEEVIDGKYVLLNRAPTLHRLSVQAFKPKMIEGKAIQIHPLVCAAFNADFDGDQMAVHLPLSEQAQREARELVSASKNLLRLQTGAPIITPSQDIVLGVYWMTRMVDGVRGEGKYFSTTNEALTAWDFGEIDFRAKIFVLGTPGNPRYSEFGDKPFETTAGRLLFNSILPHEFGFINKEIKNKDISAIIDRIIKDFGIDVTAVIVDKLKAFGNKYVTYSGTTFGMSDIHTPIEKEELVRGANEEVIKIENQYESGLITDDEKTRKIIGTWEIAWRKMEDYVADEVEKSISLHDMITSGARGSIANALQMSGIVGLIQGPTGKTIDFPVISSYVEGLNPLEYFTTTHGSRKGLADTALKTAKAGYLTRKLHDVAQDVVVNAHDCGTNNGIKVRRNDQGYVKSFHDRLFGRTLLSAINHGDIKYNAGDVLKKHDAEAIDKSDIEEVVVRSPLHCKNTYGVCRLCYGLDLGRNILVKEGEAVGTIASQSIGEPGTQLTMRTFHAGGVAGLDITAGLPRVEELFERRIPKSPALICPVTGTVSSVKNSKDEHYIEILSNTEITQSGKKTKNPRFEFERNFTPRVREGDTVVPGDLLTDGSANLEHLFATAGRERLQEYIINEAERVYDINSAPVAQKHLEIIVRQMTSCSQIEDSGDSAFTEGGIIENMILESENADLIKNGKNPAKARNLVLSITEIASKRFSWISAASFQGTTRVLVDNSLLGETDPLRGLKENIIVGNLIPAGTGYSEDFINNNTDAPSSENTES